MVVRYFLSGVLLLACVCSIACVAVEAAPAHEACRGEASHSSGCDERALDGDTSRGPFLSYHESELLSRPALSSPRSLMHVYRSVSDDASGSGYQSTSRRGRSALPALLSPGNRQQGLSGTKSSISPRRVPTEAYPAGFVRMTPPSNND